MAYHVHRASRLASPVLITDSWYKIEQIEQNLSVTVKFVVRHRDTQLEAKIA